MKQNKGISLIVIIMIIAVIVVGVAVSIVAIKGGENKQVANKNDEAEISTEDKNTTKEEIKENQNDKDYELQKIISDCR